VAVLCFEAAAVAVAAGVLHAHGPTTVRRIGVPAAALAVLATAVPAATATHGPAAHDHGGPTAAHAAPPGDRMRLDALTAGMTPAQVEEAVAAQARWLADYLVSTGVEASRAADFSVRALRAVLNAGTGNGGHGHVGPVPNRPITDPTVRTALGDQLAAARAAALALPSVADAQRAGYVLAAPHLLGLGSHWINTRYLADGVFDPARPEVLLYAGNGPTARVVGVSYLALDPTAPEGFAGPNDAWHHHDDLCRVGRIVVPYPDRGACAGVGGEVGGGFAGTRLWMTHAWVVPGWESPWGLFSGENPELTLAVGRDV